MKTVKSILIICFVLAALVFLALPGKKSSEIPPGRVEVRYWEKWSGREAESMKEIVDWFNRTVGAEKGIWVSYISMSAVDQKTLCATAAGVPPDVAGVWNQQAALWGEMDALEPLDEMAAAKGITREHYKDVYYEAGRYKGKLYSLPSPVMSIALYWNKQIFKDESARLLAAGLDPNRPPKTMAELDKYIQTLDIWDKPKEEGGRLIRPGFLPQEPGWFLTAIPYYFGGQYFDEQTGELTINHPKNVEALEWIANFTKRIGLRQMNDFRATHPDGFESPQNPFIAGTVAMVLQGPWVAGYFESNRPDLHRLVMSKEEEMKLPAEQRRVNYVWGVGPFPSAVPGLENVTSVGYDALVIPKGSRHKEEAFEFIAFVQRQEVMERLCSNHRANSPLAKSSPEFIDDHLNPYIGVFEDLALSPNARRAPPLPIWSELNAEVLVAIERSYLLEVTPQEALQDAQDRMQRKYDRFKEIQAKRNQ